MNSDANQIAYLRWLYVAHPDIYLRAIGTAKSTAGLRGLGWINLVIQAVGIAAGAAAQKKAIDKQSSLAKKQLAADAAALAADREQQAKLALLEVNTKRAQAGLPPVDINGVVIPGSALPTPPTLAPLVASVGQPTAAYTLIPGVPNYVVYGGGALVLVGLLFAMRK